MNRITLYLDEDVRPLLAEILSERGYEAYHTLDKSNSGKTDLQQLLFASEIHAAILTHNVRDFPFCIQLFSEMERNILELFVHPK